MSQKRQREKFELEATSDAPFSFQEKGAWGIGVKLRVHSPNNSPLEGGQGGVVRHHDEMKSIFEKHCKAAHDF